MYGKWEVLRYVLYVYCSGKKILNCNFYIGATVSVLVSLGFGYYFLSSSEFI